MPELPLLGLEVADGLAVRAHLERDALDDLEAIPLDRDVLVGVVRQDADLPQPEVVEDLTANPVVAVIGLEAERLVRLDRVLSLVLELVGAELVAETDPAPLLPEIQDHALSFGSDDVHGALELAPTVAAHRAEDVPRQTF